MTCKLITNKYVLIIMELVKVEPRTVRRSYRLVIKTQVFYWYCSQKNFMPSLRFALSHLTVFYGKYRTPWHPLNQKILCFHLKCIMQLNNESLFLYLAAFRQTTSLLLDWVWDIFRERRFLVASNTRETKTLWSCWLML